MMIQTTPTTQKGTELDPARLVAANWPDTLQAWFGRLMAGNPPPPPELSLDIWESWLKSVDRHGLSSLIFSQLRPLNGPLLPPSPIFDTLRTTYYQEVARTLVRRKQLDNLLKSLETAGINSLVLKGPALGEQVYPDVFRRPASDIDILVVKADFEAARKVLLRNGYRSKRGDRTRQMGWSCDEEFLPATGDETRQFVVELHWALTSHAQLVNKIEAGELIGRSDRLSGQEKSFQVLNPVDALVYACLHLFYKHINELRLIWLYDIHLLAQRIENQGLWHEVIVLSQQWQARLALKNCLQLARHWFGSPVPDEALDLDYKPASLEETQLFNLVIFQLEHGRREGWLKKHLFQLSRLEGWDKFHYLKSRLFPTRQEMEANYPALRVWPGPLVQFGRFIMMFLSKK